MRAVFCALLMSLYVSSAFGDEFRKNTGSIQEPAKAAEDSKVIFIQNLSRKDPPPPKSDYTLTYLRSGKSLGTLNRGNNYNFFLGSIGHRRYFGHYFFGGEYTYHHQGTGVRAQDLSALIGYRAFESLGFNPYAGISFGMGWLVNTEEQKYNGNGVAVAFDIGCTVYENDFFSSQAGLKRTTMQTNNNDFKSAVFNDLYFGFGVKF